MQPDEQQSADGLVFRRPSQTRFEALSGFDYPPNYADVGGLRMHYVDAGPRSAAPIVLLHGEPTWGYLYRHMIARLTAAGHRVLVPDLIGFGRSDKPIHGADYSYQAHVDWARAWLRQLDLTDITLFGQDWGSLIGLRLVAEHDSRFARVFIGNGFLPTGDEPMSWLIHAWRAFARISPVFPVGAILQAGSRRWLSAAERAAYRAPFADRRDLAGARALPRLIPMQPNDPASAANRAAWAKLEAFSKPFHTCFAAGDPVTRGMDRPFRRRVPGAAGVAHTTIRGARHFLQEDQGPAIADFMLAQIGRG
ncbi:haloalkane dehalogenase [Salinisphaera sp. SPP-AMP-43]|uniref:haloalkane dehalogenase n=1 Tax=Salinisphaera sp. SPP-AMP-43 TaxID=3121288 RepID=UPI003C6E3B94